MPPLGTMAPKSTSKENDDFLKTACDESRQTGPDPRDPRWKGPPCMGKHVAQAPGRGSRSGSNQFAKWEVCEKCQIRLSYTPVYGAHGIYRQAGPLPADVTTVTSRIIEEGDVDNKNVTKEDLQMRNIALEGAERSMERRLAEIRRQRQKESGKKEKESATKDKKSPKSMNEDVAEVPEVSEIVREPHEEVIEWTDPEGFEAPNVKAATSGAATVTRGSKSMPARKDEDAQSVESSTGSFELVGTPGTGNHRSSSSKCCSRRRCGTSPAE